LILLGEALGFLLEDLIGKAFELIGERRFGIEEEGECRFQYCLSFISTRMSRIGVRRSK
jgi:hypothetical protein